MHRKTTTSLNNYLFRWAKLHVLRIGKCLVGVVNKAWTTFLAGETYPKRVGGIVQASFGSIQVDPEDVRKIVDKEGDFLDS